MGAKSSKRYSSLKSLFNFSKLLLNFLPSGPHKVLLELSLRYLTIFFFENFNFTVVPYGEIKNLNYMENERS